jgi:hypothetical protein
MPYTVDVPLHGASCGWPQVLREARAVYRVVCEGVINLADKFFEMERADALK